MANKNRNDINQEIQDIIKSNPGATDVTKLQGIRHRQLLTDIMDYIDEQVAAAVAVADGEFPFPWPEPSNAFGGYSNSETTFKAGMYKFLHRDTPPRANLSADTPIRQKGSSNSVVLSYSAAPGTAPLASIVVDSTTVPLMPPSGTLNRATSTNTNTIYTMKVTDNAGYVAQAYAEVIYLNKLFIFSDAADYFTYDDVTKSTQIAKLDGQLTSNRESVSNQNTQYPNDQFIYIAYPVSLGSNPKIYVNTLEDNSFTTITFNFTNSNGYTEPYYLLKSANLLSSTYSVIIK